MDNKLSVETALHRHSPAAGWHIEFSEFFSNHLAHGIVALVGLGFSPPAVDRFAEFYIGGHPLVPLTVNTKPPFDGHAASALLGRKQGFDKLVNLMRHELTTKHQGDIGALVAARFPGLCDGISGAASHALIHTGLGLHAQSAKMTVEGAIIISP